MIEEGLERLKKKASHQPSKNMLSVSKISFMLPEKYITEDIELCFIRE